MKFRFGHLEPMYLTLIEEPFDSPDYFFEVKWDGIRGLGFYPAGGTFRLQSRNGKDITPQFPEVVENMNLFGRKAGRDFVLDGELCVLNEEGKPDFELIKRRVLSRKRQVIDEHAARRPASYLIWDLLLLGEDDLTLQPLVIRREKLTALMETCRGDVKHLFLSPLYAHGKDLFQTVKAEGLEGIVAKRKDSPYLPGKRTLLWQKIKNFQSGRVVVGGFFPEKKGSYVVGVYDARGRLVSLGSLGGGLTAEEVRALNGILAELRIEKSPFAGGEEYSGAVWVEPVIVLKVSFLEATSKNSLRHAVIEGIDLAGKPHTCTRQVLESDKCKKEVK